MKQNLLSRIIWSCPHQFSWPRRDDSGGYYQLCVNCGTKYRYDWKRMQRTSRMDDEVATETRRPHRVAKITWKARERRLRHVVPVMYRLCDLGDWIPGCSVNVSRSGLLFRGAVEIPEGAQLELMLAMPEEITGEWAAEVSCKGTVTRITPVPGNSKEPPSFLIACSVEDYEFGKKPMHHIATGTDHNRVSG